MKPLAQLVLLFTALIAFVAAATPTLQGEYMVEAGSSDSIMWRLILDYDFDDNYGTIYSVDVAIHQIFTGDEQSSVLYGTIGYVYGRYIDMTLTGSGSEVDAFYELQTWDNFSAGDSMLLAQYADPGTDNQWSIEMIVTLVTDSGTLVWTVDNTVTRPGWSSYSSSSSSSSSSASSASSDVASSSTVTSSSSSHTLPTSTPTLTGFYQDPTPMWIVYVPGSMGDIQSIAITMTRLGDSSSTTFTRYATLLDGDGFRDAQTVSDVQDDSLSVTFYPTEDYPLTDGSFYWLQVTATVVNGYSWEANAHVEVTLQGDSEPFSWDEQFTVDGPFASTTVSPSSSSSSASSSSAPSSPYNSDAVSLTGYFQDGKPYWRLTAAVTLSTTLRQLSAIINYDNSPVTSYTVGSTTFSIDGEQVPIITQSAGIWTTQMLFYPTDSHPLGVGQVFVMEFSGNVISGSEWTADILFQLSADSRDFNLEDVAEYTYQLSYTVHGSEEVESSSSLESTSSVSSSSATVPSDDSSSQVSTSSTLESISYSTVLSSSSSSSASSSSAPSSPYNSDAVSLTGYFQDGKPYWRLTAAVTLSTTLRQLSAIINYDNSPVTSYTVGITTFSIDGEQVPIRMELGLPQMSFYTSNSHPLGNGQVFVMEFSGNVISGSEWTADVFLLLSADSRDSNLEVVADYTYQLSYTVHGSEEVESSSSLESTSSVLSSSATVPSDDSSTQILLSSSSGSTLDVISSFTFTNSSSVVSSASGIASITSSKMTTSSGGLYSTVISSETSAPFESTSVGPTVSTTSSSLSVISATTTVTTTATSTGGPIAGSLKDGKPSWNVVIPGDFGDIQSIAMVVSRSGVDPNSFSFVSSSVTIGGSVAQTATIQLTPVSITMVFDPSDAEPLSSTDDLDFSFIADALWGYQWTVSVHIEITTSGAPLNPLQFFKRDVTAYDVEFTVTDPNAVSSSLSSSSSLSVAASVSSVTPDVSVFSSSSSVGATPGALSGTSPDTPSGTSSGTSSVSSPSIVSSAVSSVGSSIVSSAVSSVGSSVGSSSGSSSDASFFSDSSTTVASTVPAIPTSTSTSVASNSSSSVRSSTAPHVSLSDITTTSTFPTPKQSTTVVVITSCSENKCSPASVTTGVTVITATSSGVVTTYTTYCALTLETAVSVSAPTTLLPKGSTTVVIITSCEGNVCSQIPVTKTGTVRETSPVANASPSTPTIVTTTTSCFNDACSEVVVTKTIGPVGNTVAPQTNTLNIISNTSQTTAVSKTTTVSQTTSLSQSPAVSQSVVILQTPAISVSSQGATGFASVTSLFEGSAMRLTSSVVACFFMLLTFF